MLKFSFTGKQSRTLLCRLETRRWGIGELQQAVLQIPNARILYQLERWPWYRTIIYAGNEANYRIKLPRAAVSDVGVVPRCPIAIYASARSPAARKEIRALLTRLASTP